MWPNPKFPADLVTFTENTLNGKLHFLSSVFAKKTRVFSVQQQEERKIFLYSKIRVSKKGHMFLKYQNGQ